MSRADAGAGTRGRKNEQVTHGPRGEIERQRAEQQQLHAEELGERDRRGGFVVHRVPPLEEERLEMVLYVVEQNRRRDDHGNHAVSEIAPEPSLPRDAVLALSPLPRGGEG